LKYTALSYCLGSVDKHKTTKATVRDNDQVLDFDALPRTIQNSIKVTFELGYIYLWVDYLCIVHDDPKELQQEIAKMPDVYSGAIVTIAASVTPVYITD
ncbi:heterokaryon incompatibility, partial [Massarina eburnea CBS 473.64]